MIHKDSTDYLAPPSFGAAAIMVHDALQRDLRRADDATPHRFFRNADAVAAHLRAFEDAGKSWDQRLAFAAGLLQEMIAPLNNGVYTDKDLMLSVSWEQGADANRPTVTLKLWGPGPNGYWKLASWATVYEVGRPLVVTY